MENQDSFKRADDRARLMTRLSAIGGVGALVLLITIIVLSSQRGGDVLTLAILPFVLALFFALAALVYGILFTGAQREEEEKLLLAKRMESRALDVEEDVRFTAGRTFSNYNRFAPFVISAAGAVITGLLLWKIHSIFSFRASQDAVMSGNVVHTALISAVLMMISVFSGAFFIGQSRVSGFRWLRPVGAWMMCGFLTLFAASASALFYASNITSVDKSCATVIFWIFAVLGAEFAVNFIIEFYRPRTVGESRPVFESQLLALFTEPGGVIRNIAAALDYQFGFKVSGTWIYSFIERSFFPVLILWALLFWGFTCIHEIGANQLGIKERFGKVSSELLTPGVYWTLPYPFGNMQRFSCTELHRVVIGESVEGAAERASSSVVLWTNNHGGAKEPFIVAVPDQNASGETSISFVNLSIPIEYRIRKDGVMDYAYGNASPVKVLKMIGQKAAVEFLSQASMDELMSHGRGKAEKTLKENIQKLADANRLGIEIVWVGIMDAHPPVEKVAPAYQNVIGALEEKETEILKAKAYAETILPESKAAALEIVANAESTAFKTKTVAAAESERFRYQLKSYRAMPAMFRLNAQMEMLENDCKDIRKYIISSKLADEVYQLNFETRDRLDLVDLEASELSNETKK